MPSGYAPGPATRSGRLRARAGYAVSAGCAVGPVIVARRAAAPGTAITGPARGAPAIDGEVAEVRLEAVVFVQSGYQGLDRVRGNLGDAAAGRADQVHVIRFGRHVVPGSAVSQVGVGDQAELFQQLQRAVDGRDVHPAGRLPHVRPDLLGTGMLKLGDGPQPKLPLGLDALAAGPQLLVPRLRHGPETRAWQPGFGPLRPACVRRACRWSSPPGPGPAEGDGQWSSGSIRHARPITRLPLPAYLT